MNFNSFVIKNIQSNIKRYFMYWLCTTFSMIIFFMFSNLWFIHGFQENTRNPIQQLMFIAGTITVVFSIFLITYTHNMFIKHRLSEFGLLMSYGMLYSDLKKMIVIENLMIYLTSLFSSFLCGSVFSRLFFLISKNMLNLSNIEYTLSLKSFWFTTFVFVPIFIIVILISLNKLKNTDIIQLIKAKKQIELKTKGSLTLGLIGLIIIVVTSISMYSYSINVLSDKVVNKTVLLLSFGCILGLYLVTTNFSSLFYYYYKQRQDFYYPNLLIISDFATHFKQNRRTLFVITLLNFAIILFTVGTYTLHSSSYDLAEKEQIFDLAFHEIEGFNSLDPLQLEVISEETSTPITNTAQLDYLLMEATNIKIETWRTSTWLPIISVNNFNAVFNTEYSVSSGKTLQIIFESSLSKYYSFFHDEVIHLVTDANEILLTTENIIYNKVLDRYSFSQPILLLVSDDMFQQLYQETLPIERGTLYLVSFDSWMNSNNFLNIFTDIYNDNYHAAISANKSLADELIDARYGHFIFQIRAKMLNYNSLKALGSFSLFIMGFISLLFIFASGVIIYFKVFSDVETDKFKFQKLDGIGFLKKEKLNYIKGKLTLLMLVPTIFGSLMGAIWFYTLNLHRLIEIELNNKVGLINSLIIMTLYLLTSYLYYHHLKKKYYNALK